MFWIKYVIVAALASVAVYFGVPAVMERLSQDADEEDLEFSDEVVSIAPAHTVPQRARPVATSSPIPRRPKRNVAQTGDDSGSFSLPPPPHGVVEDAQSGGSDVPTQAADAPAQPSEPVVEEPPRPKFSVEKIPVSSGDVVRFGVIMYDAAAYKGDGKRLPKKAPGGTLVEISEAVATKKGAEMAKCVLWDGHRWVGPYLIAAIDLLMFEGGREGLLAEDIDNLLEYYRLNSELVARKEALEQAVINANPHAAQLREMTREYNALADRVKDLTAKRDESKGATRVKISEELRKLEALNTKKQQALKRQVNLYNKWKENHKQEAADFANDPKYVSIKRKMDELRPQVVEFGVD